MIYNRFKNKGSPYFGYIPIDWNVLELGELGYFKNGINFPRSAYGKGVAIINVKNLYNGRYVDLESLNEIKKESIKKYKDYLVNEGDILFARSSLVNSGAAQASMVHFQKMQETVYSGFIIRFRLNTERRIVQEFLNYLLRSKAYRAYLPKILASTAITNISQETLKKLPIITPPFLEQKAIAKILSDLDSKIELNQKMNKTLEAIAQAIFKHWFIDFEFPNEEGKPYKSSGGEMVDSELGEIPKGWKIGYLGDLLNIRREHCDPSQETRTLPYVPIDCISKKSLMLTDHKPGEEARSSLIKFHKFDIIFGAMRPYFHKVCIAPFEGTTRTTAFVFYPKDLNDYAFLVLTVFSERTIKYANLNSTGSTIPYAAWENSLETMPIVIPFTAVRHNFNKIIANMLISIGEYLPNQIVTLKNILDSLVPRLMTGKIRVPLEE